MPPNPPHPSRHHLAQKLTVLRTLHKLTRQQLADLSHIPETIITAMESGQHHPNHNSSHPHHPTRITLDHLDAVAHTLGIPITYLFTHPNGTPEERIILAMLEVER